MLLLFLQLIWAKQNGLWNRKQKGFQNSKIFLKKFYFFVFFASFYRKMSNTGLQLLLDAEKQAQELVAKARKEKLQMMKTAREEARDEIQKFRKEKDAEYQEFEKTHSGDTDDATAQMKKKTEDGIAAIKKDTEENSQRVVDMLIDYVVDVEKFETA